MKKVIIVLIAMLFIFTACTKAEQEEAAENLLKQEEQEETKASEKPTDKPTPAPTPEPTPTPEPLPMQVAVVVCRDGYAPSEFHPVMDALAAAGYEPVIVSDQLGTADGYGETVEVEKTFNDFTGGDLRGIAIIGGSESLWENADLHRLLNEVHELNRVTAGICLNSVALMKAGIIGEGDSACWFNCDITDPEMEAAGVADSGKPVTVDGNIITGDGPDASEEFAAEIVAALDAL